MVSVKIKMMGGFAIYIDGEKADDILRRKRKSMDLIRYLILKQEGYVASSELIRFVFGKANNVNPASSLKTLICRTRVILDNIFPSLGTCIVSDHGGYHWDCNDIVKIDLYELDENLRKAEMANELNAELQNAFIEILDLYQGKQSNNRSSNKMIEVYFAALHKRYLDAVLRYVGMLKKAGEYMKVISVLQSALGKDPNEGCLRSEFLEIVIYRNENENLLDQTIQIPGLSSELINTWQPEAMREIRNQGMITSRKMDTDLGNIRNDLMGSRQKACMFAITCFLRRFTAFKSGTLIDCTIRCC